ncbi:protein ACCELERATED CELL DEATH 6 [Cinnamomum micranthum f. kanehirae]|uniref:Protein ACCELERATED CELL DEATH 6 n=1 Tax=Cinnamomum micranthum f. kanehirae TaxID=337451 RepID=A0A3S3NIH6_9MAGN|nr:protein ACCELERATED CELL DEATH 6 [Cinnamomum micranthum f. kanehirae]
MDDPVERMKLVLNESMDDREFPMIGVDNMDPKLYNAARSGNVEHLTSIVDANPGTNLNRCLTPQRNTVLHIAVKFEQQKIVQRMIQQWPSLISQPNSKGDTPLHMAARAGNHDLTKLLTPASNLTEGNSAIEEGNPVRQAGGVALRMSNSEGSNPIHEALKKSHKEVALHLLAFEERHGLARDVNMAGESLLYLAAEAGLDEVVNRIIDIGDYSTRGPDGQNPLHIAVIKSRFWAG